MPPEIAALICSAFILTLFVIDFKRKPNVTIYHWIPFIWLLILSSRPLVQWLNPTGMADIEPVLAISEGSVVDRNVLIILIIAALIILSTRIKNCTQILKNNPWIILFLLYCSISVLWSDYQSISFKRWFRGVGTFIIVLVILTEIDPLETIKTMLRRCAFLMIPLSILFIKYYRQLGVYYGEYGGAGYAGVTTGKNPLGRLCLILGFYFFWEIFSNWKNQNNKEINRYKTILFVNIIILLMIFWLLKKADSATSLACLIFAVFILLLLNLPGLRRNINIVLFLSVIILFILSATIDIEKIFLTILNRDPTLTGRTELWSLCLTFVKNPLIGVGYESFWLGERLQIFWSKYWWHPIQAHNGYIDTYLDLGMIGLFLLLGLILSIYKRIKKTLNNDFYLGIFQLPFFIAYLIYNITENAFGLSSLFWFVFLIVVLIQDSKDGQPHSLYGEMGKY